MMLPTRTLVQTIMVIVTCCASACGSADGESMSAPAQSSTVTAPSPDDVPRSDLKNPHPLGWSKAEVVVPRPLDPMALQEGVAKALQARPGAVVPAG